MLRWLRHKWRVLRLRWMLWKMKRRLHVIQRAMGITVGDIYTPYIPIIKLDGFDVRKEKTRSDD